MTARYSKDALEAIQQIYDNPRLTILADRLEEILTVLDEDPGDQRVRKRHMQQSRLWKVVSYGPGEAFTFFWDQESGDTWVRWAGLGEV